MSERIIRTDDAVEKENEETPLPYAIRVKGATNTWTTSGKRLCDRCRHLRTRTEFGGFDVCVYCGVDQAREHLASLESRVNSIVPKGRRLQEPCQHCQELNWWNNLEVHINDSGKEQMWCTTCRGDDHVKRWFAETQGVKHFTEQGKISKSTLNELLEDMEL